MWSYCSAMQQLLILTLVPGDFIAAELGSGLMILRDYLHLPSSIHHLLIFTKISKGKSWSILAPSWAPWSHPAKNQAGTLVSFFSGMAWYLGVGWSMLKWLNTQPNITRSVLWVGLYSILGSYDQIESDMIWLEYKMSPMRRPPFSPTGVPRSTCWVSVSLSGVVRHLLVEPNAGNVLWNPGALKRCCWVANLGKFPLACTLEGEEPEHKDNAQCFQTLHAYASCQHQVLLEARTGGVQFEWRHLKQTEHCPRQVFEASVRILKIISSEIPQNKPCEQSHSRSSPVAGPSEATRSRSLHVFQTHYIIYIDLLCWPYFWADAHRRLRRATRPSISSQCGLESYWMRTCFRNIFLMFFVTV